MTLVTLALRKGEDSTAPATSDGNQVVDTRSDLAQMTVPVATIAGIDVWLPVVASATSGSKQNQNAAGHETQTNGNSATGDPLSGNNATVTNSAGTVQTAGVTTQVSSQQAALAQFFGPNLQSVSGPAPQSIINSGPLSGPAAPTVPEPTVWLLTALGLASILYRAKSRMA